MGTRGDHASLHSSIALLQERFRQLQKMREMRQERELLHVLSVSESERLHDPGTMQKYANYQHSSSPTLLFDQSQLINFQQKPIISSQLALSLWQDSQMFKNSNLGGFQTENETTTTIMTTNKPWLQGKNLGYKSEAAFMFDDSLSDIDTSLHL